MNMSHNYDFCIKDEFPRLDFLHGSRFTAKVTQMGPKRAAAGQSILTKCFYEN
jgi:hypothetical protein